jgi:hypothetical protein
LYLCKELANCLACADRRASSSSGRSSAAIADVPGLAGLFCGGASMGAVVLEAASAPSSDGSAPDRNGSSLSMTGSFVEQEVGCRWSLLFLWPVVDRSKTY